MKAVWKYEVPSSPGAFEKALPIAAEILTVACQHNRPVMWVLVDPDAEKEYRSFFIAETGKSIDHAPLKPIGTVQLDGGSYVLHVFEVLQ